MATVVQRQHPEGLWIKENRRLNSKGLKIELIDKPRDRNGNRSVKRKRTINRPNRIKRRNKL